MSGKLGGLHGKGASDRVVDTESLPDGSEILSYYERIDEANRLARGSGSLEFARMQEIIRRFLPPPPGVVLDVGGGPGRYSCWLSRAMPST